MEKNKLGSNASKCPETSKNEEKIFSNFEKKIEMSLKSLKTKISKICIQVLVALRYSTFGVNLNRIGPKLTEE